LDVVHPGVRKGCPIFVTVSRRSHNPLRQAHARCS
jgi:hypothetical protein